MGLSLSIKYRGLLSGCNYDCHYCPFAKRIDDRKTLAQDAADLNRFVEWVEGRPKDNFKILFTPWGEALIRKPYQSALCRLSQMPQVSRVSIQTNLSCSLGWVNLLNKNTASLWCTYHPEEVSLEKFLSQCSKLDQAGISYCVGTVGTKDAFEAISNLRKKLPKHIYLWINAYKDEGPDYYTAPDIEFLKNIDPKFEVNLIDHSSLGRACHAGERAVAIDGKGDVRRCHFIPGVIGNIYDAPLEDALRPRLCDRKICECHIGYSNIPDLDLDATFDGWALGRMLPHSSAV